MAGKINKLMSELKFYLLLQSYAWKIQFIYRADFIMYAFTSAIYIIITLVFVGVIYTVTFSVAGWSYFQLLLLIAIAGLGINISDYLIDSGFVFDVLWNGGFDNYLTKPHNPLLYVIGESTDTAAIGDIAGYLILFVYAAMNTQFSAPALLAFLILFILGVAVLSMLQVLFLAISYKFINKAGWVGLIIDLAENFSRYPLTLYGIIGVVLFTIVVPLGIATFYPAGIIVGKLSLAGYLVVIAIGVILAFMFYKLSKYLLRSYTSAMG